MRNLLLPLLLLIGLSPMTAQAQSAEQGLEGAWALKIGDAIIYRFELESGEGGQWSGSWTRPEQMASSGVIFSQMSGSVTVAATSGMARGKDVELAFADRRPDAIKGLFVFHQTGEDQARLTHVGMGYEPYPLIRVEADAPLGPFADNMIYDRDNAVSEPEPSVPSAVEEVPLDLPPLDLVGEPTPHEAVDEDPAQPAPEESAEPAKPANEEPSDPEPKSEPEPAEPQRVRIGDDFLEGF